MTKGKICINLEFKTDDYETTYLTLKLVKEKGMLHQIDTSSYFFKVRENVMKACEELKIDQKIHFGFLMWLDEWEEPELKPEYKGDSINLDSRMLTAKRESCMSLIKRAKDLGMYVKFYFLRSVFEDQEIWDDFINSGCDTIITDQPIELLEYMQSI